MVEVFGPSPPVRVPANRCEGRFSLSGRSEFYTPRSALMELKRNSSGRLVVKAVTWMTHRTPTGMDVYLHDGEPAGKDRSTLLTRRILFFSAAMMAGALGGLLLRPTPAGAVAREIIELRDGITRLTMGQQSMQTAITQDYAIERTLIEESLDAVKNLSLDMAALPKITQDSSATAGARLETIGTTIEGVSDNVADLQARLVKFDQKLADVESVIQNVESKLTPPTR